MARGYPGIIYPYPAASNDQTDIERMSRESLRRFLRHRLRTLDARMSLLTLEEPLIDHRLASASSVPPEAWDKLLELDYLQTMREAIMATLAAL